jgi:hypothetical protein
MIPTLVEDAVRNEILYPYIDQNRSPTFKYVEIGVFVGGNISRVADRYQDIKIYAVDYFKFDNISYESFRLCNVDIDGSYLGQFIRNTKQYSNITTCIYESLEASDTFEDNSIDCLFIDGAHREYDYHMLELKKWVQKVKDGGLIAGHDWPEENIKRAVYDTFKQHQIIGCSSNGAYGVIK